MKYQIFAARTYPQLGYLSISFLPPGSQAGDWKIYELVDGDWAAVKENVQAVDDEKGYIDYLPKNFDYATWPRYQMTKDIEGKIIELNELVPLRRSGRFRLVYTGENAYYKNRFKL